MEYRWIAIFLNEFTILRWFDLIWFDTISFQLGFVYNLQDFSLIWLRTKAFQSNWRDKCRKIVNDKWINIKASVNFACCISLDLGSFRYFFILIYGASDLWLTVCVTNSIMLHFTCFLSKEIKIQAVNYGILFGSAHLTFFEGIWKHWKHLFLS